jgi:thiamine-monophosphate kinase
MAMALTLPESWRGEFLRLCDGVGEAARAAGTHIVGGDLSRGESLSLAITAVGHVATPLSRRGARAGNALWVTGALGGPLLALRAWERGGTPSAENRARFASPTARLEEARWLLAHGATAGLDISDGVVSDASHLAAAGSVRVVIDLERLPVFGTATLDVAARSGEEYELLVTAPASLDASAFETQFGIRLTNVGAVEATVPGAPSVEVRRHGERVDAPRGHDHFPPT